VTRKKRQSFDFQEGGTGIQKGYVEEVIEEGKKSSTTQEEDEEREGPGTQKAHC